MRPLFRYIAGLLFVALPVSLSYAGATTPAATVENLHTALADVMRRSETLGYNGRYQRLEPVINSSFNNSKIARIVVGQRWKSLDKQQRKRFIDTFGRLVIATYSNRFDGFSGEHFRFISEQPIKRGRVMVRTEITGTEDGPVKLDYILEGKNDDWRIVNVIVDGVSDLAIKRADYSSVLKADGYTVLLDKLNRQIKDFESP